jgi:hypothetical protein
MSSAGATPHDSVAFEPVADTNDFMSVKDSLEDLETRGDGNHTSSSSASSARSMMNRNRAEASRPISSLITRSVTI